MVLNFLVEDLAFVVHGYTVSNQSGHVKSLLQLNIFYRVG